MFNQPLEVAFFDIGDTLGSVIIAPDFAYIERIEVFPHVEPVLRTLKKDLGLRLGVISNPGPIPLEHVHRALDASGLLNWLDPALLVFGRKDTRQLFINAAALARLQPAECLYVGEDAQERTKAREAGYRVVAHPTLAIAAVQGEDMRYLRVTLPADNEPQWWEALQAEAVVPLHVTRDVQGATVLVIASDGTAARLDAMRFPSVDRLAADPDTTEIFLLRDDHRDATGDLVAVSWSQEFFAGTRCTRVLSSSREGIFVAIPSEESIEEYHFPHARHGHTLKLVPDLGLVRPFGTVPGGVKATFLRALTEIIPTQLHATEIDEVLKLDARMIVAYIDHYTGGPRSVDSNWSSETPIVSRHISHSDNQRAVRNIVRELDIIGRGKFTVGLHRFTHQGEELYNVEAELLGVSEEEAVRNSIVLISAHLDSTAILSDGGFNPSMDPAPGADDDASGIAAVLSIAQIIRAVADVRPPSRTIRFLLFNAEEHGLVGSKAYARAQRMKQASIIAVYQMDMIGFRGANIKPFPFEVHLGAPGSPDIEDRSIALLQQIKIAVEQVAADVLAEPQVYVSQDPAAGRSDHASFHEQGYAACVISENDFAGPAHSSPTPQDNPNYHKDTDTRISGNGEEKIDAEYAAGIARVVAAAVLSTARA